MTKGHAAWLPTYSLLAQSEAGVRRPSRECPDVAVYPRYLVKEARDSASEPMEFFFSGSVGALPDSRGWVREFAASHFDDTSLYCDTTKEAGAECLGKWDVSDNPPFRTRTGIHWRRLGTPRSDPFYWSCMASARYVLCPVGSRPDYAWSLRTYECFMVGAIPVVEERSDVCRNQVDADIGMECVLASEWEPGCGTGIAERNWKRFQKHHMLPERVKEAS